MAQNLLNSRDKILKSVSDILENSKKYVQQYSVERVEILIEKLEEKWVKFHKIEDELPLDTESFEGVFTETFLQAKSILLKRLKDYNAQLPSPSLSNAQNQNDAFRQLLDQQRLFLEGLNDRTSILNTTIMNSTGPAYDKVRLPKINIEPFSGDYISWPNFFDLYKSTVHSNPNISNVHKFQLLKGLLRDSAASLLEGMTVTDDNYPLAYEKLVKRYDKKKPIMNAMISSFLNQPTAIDGGVISLRHLCDLSDKIINSMKSLGERAESRDPWLVQILLQKIDKDSQEAWALKMVDEDFPTISCFLDFISTRCDAKEGLLTAPKVKIDSNSSRKSNPTKCFKSTDSSTKTTVCPHCNYEHALNRCMKFRKLPVHTRRTLVNKYHVCYNCLKSGHSSGECSSQQVCRHCNAKHHSLLHASSSPITTNENTTSLPSTSSANAPSPNNVAPQSNTLALHAHHTVDLTTPDSVIENPSVLNSRSVDLNGDAQTPCFNTLSPFSTILPTALVKVRDVNGRMQVARVLLDSASTASFVSENLVQRLGLPRTFCNKSITGISDTPAGFSKGRVSLQLHAHSDAHYGLDVPALILSKISSVIPSEPMLVPDSASLRSLTLADPTFYTPSKIDILLGAERALHCLSGQKLMINDNLVALSTIFGWIIGGECTQSTSHNHSSYTMHASDEDLNVSLQRFWTLEEVPVQVTSEDCLAETHYVSNLQRTNNGRYCVKLPFKEHSSSLGNSKKAALVRLFAMERRFQSNRAMKEEYIKFLREYSSLGHMELVKENEVDVKDEKCFYLPHHAVMKTDSSTTKLRVVFDGSCSSSTGVSLNDTLLTGPTIQSDLAAILLRFRKYPIVYAADVEKMYRQVLVHEDDCDFQRIFWREDPTQPIKSYRLRTVTYGLTSAPFLAIRTLHQIANDCPDILPEIKNKIKCDFYVDDFLSGSETVDDAKVSIQQVANALKHGKFPLRKWRSNSQEILDVIPEHLKETEILHLVDDSCPSIKTLGLKWNPAKDVFIFAINITKLDNTTKRNLLSDISRIFDPIGWLSPMTLALKIMFQQLWRQKIKWDEQISGAVKREWSKFCHEMKSIENIEIPRHVMLRSSSRNVQLHAFCDASEMAYGTVTYLRIEDQHNNVHVTILSAKTRVSPLSQAQLTLPRLELCGAVLLANLVQYLLTALKVENIEIRAWCDSQIVLAWLASPPQKWKQFVANRTSHILSIVPRENWNYVRSNQNPADVASRGLSPNNLQSHSLWWNGPSWLKLSPTEWPNFDTTLHDTEEALEQRREPKSQVHTVSLSNDVLDWFLLRYSSFNKMKRMIGRIIWKAPPLRNLDLVDILRKAEQKLLRHVQEQSFHHGITALRNKLPISDNKLLPLNPFLDSNSLLRVGGRLQSADIEHYHKHPIILPSEHSLCTIIVRDAHLNNLHAGPSLLHSIIRQKYWIIGGKKLARQVVNQCMRCVRFRRAVPSQLMGNLPPSRVTPSRPFHNVGVDYAGPVVIKSRRGRGNIPTTKAYIALFVCMVTKAVHIELVSDMTTDAYIATLRRFVARRGLPSTITSDNGSNFVGASSELAKLFEMFTNESNVLLISNFLSLQEIKFNFIPARAPHFGGLWEANVKSIKYHLNRVTNEALLTFEEMTTLLTQIEALLNSRPVCPTSDDIHDLNVLTPGHFLIGAALTCIPEPNLEAIPTNRLSRWQNLQARCQSFWRKWSLEYLHTVQQRAKWQEVQENLKVGDLVIMKEDNIPPAQWLLARVITVHPGSEGLVRVATVKTKSGVLKRPIAKLCRLPMEITTDRPAVNII